MSSTTGRVVSDPSVAPDVELKSPVPPEASEVLLETYPFFVTSTSFLSLISLFKMGLGKADLQEKILCCTGKICLIVSGILHILFSILVFCSIAYVYGQSSEKSALYLLAPSIMAVLSALGAFLFLCCFRKQLIILISLGWPVLLFLITMVVYALIFHEFIARNYEKAQKLGLKKMHLPMEILNMFFMSISLFFIPLACHCGVVLVCLGCCKTAVEEDEHWESIDDDVGMKNRGKKGNY